MSNRFAAAATLAALLAAAGCSSPRTVDTVELSADKPHNWVNTDPNLRRVAEVTRVSKGRADDLFQVQVDVTNRTGDRRAIQYRFVWLDNQGMVVSTTLTTWQRAFIDGAQTVSLQGVAPNPRVADARLEIKLADEG
jgi:uncharacterized protein YcfL